MDDRVAAAQQRLQPPTPASADAPDALDGGPHPEGTTIAAVAALLARAQTLLLDLEGELTRWATAEPEARLGKLALEAERVCVGLAALAGQLPQGDAAQVCAVGGWRNRGLGSHS